MPDRARDLDSMHRKAIEWRLRMDEGLSSAERSEFEAWLDADPAHRRVHDEYVAMSRLAGRLPRLERRRAFARSGLRPAYATALLIAVAVAGALLLTGQNGPTAQAAEVRNPGPSTRSVRFVDGTVATLDGGAFLLARIDDGRRLVTLKAGRARFRLGRPRSAPLIVEGGGGRVEASDATFDAALASGGLQVVVVRGAVRLTVSDGEAGLPLLTGQAGRVVDEAAEFTAAPGPEDLRWPAARVAFDHAPLAEVVARAGRLGGMSIELEDEELGSRLVTGVFDLRDPRKLARILAAALDLEAREQGGSIRLVRRPS